MRAYKCFVFLTLFLIPQRIFSDGVDEEVAAESPPTTLESLISEQDEEKLSKCREKSSAESYQTEVAQMMRIIVNNLYGNKDVFLRELISNAYDAQDKVRFLSITNQTILDVNSDFSIRIRVDPVNSILSITDSGIGMTKEELMTNLGTIAKSGTREFLLKAANSTTKGGDISTIGQFGVGFYSAFLVANKVVVASKSFNDSKQYIFEADTSSYKIYEDPREDQLSRGTTILLYIDKASSEFLKEDKIISIVKKYSEFIQFPIFLYTNIDTDGKDVGYHWRRVNDVEPIWMRPKESISEEEYEHFYNVLNYGYKKEKYDKPFGVIHFNVEGQTEFKTLLFLPRHLDDEYINNPMTFVPKLKLYVRRVMVKSGMRSLLPHYLSHVIGIVDSQDLPLNVGREEPQHKELIKVMKKKITRKILDYLKKLSENNETAFLEYYKEAGNVLKFGVIEDETNANRIAKLLRFYSSASLDTQITFDTYVSRMKPDQSGILFLAAPSINEAKNSPYMERIKRKGYEVLYLIDNMDEAVMQSLRIFDGKALHNIAKEIQDDKKSKNEAKYLEEKEKEFKPLLTWLKKSYYKGSVSSVRISTKLLTSPCILVASEQGYSGNMERIIKSQTYVHGKNGGDDVLSQPKNLEINPSHPLLKMMLEMHSNDPDSNDLKESADVCLSIATLSGGYSTNDPLKLSTLIEKIYLQGRGIDYETVSQQIRDEMGVDDEEPQASTEDNSQEVPSSEDEHPESSANEEL